MPISSRKSAAFELGVTVQWTKANPINFKLGAPRDTLGFPDIPQDLEAGVYRILCEMPGRPKRVYIGEASDLRKRAASYARPSSKKGVGRVAPNRRLHARLSNALRHKGSAQYQVAETAKVGQKGTRIQKLDMTDQFHRRLIEAAALVHEQIRGDAEVINAKMPVVSAKVARP